MPRKRLSIFHKVSNLFRTSVVVAKMRKPVISKLIFLKKSRKLKRFKPLKHYNYGFLEEYEFSPSSTPLIHYRGKQYKSTRSYRDNLYSMFFHCRCLGGLKAGVGEVLEYRLSMDTLPATVANGECLEPSYLVDEEDSVDQRAERFIERVMGFLFGLEMAWSEGLDMSKAARNLIRRVAETAHRYSQENQMSDGKGVLCLLTPFMYIEKEVPVQTS
ncbi:hypothetical protein POTOM_029933 [Populus tomentosa]|uniref:Uncharacterized protein n=1 Tax=Populus tomentosa TaxID=118781 RepID=A0A8X8CTH4_POPTO|nr:hypothetical protein POTOM_029933 [Populus tomentosa]